MYIKTAHSNGVAVACTPSGGRGASQFYCFCYLSMHHPKKFRFLHLGEVVGEAEEDGAEAVVVNLLVIAAVVVALEVDVLALVVDGEEV
jgi:hypothetical protein